jgi:serine/threonine protein kinase/tetratricopeptide (TPR) repeat protein
MPIAHRYHQYELLRREDGSLWELGRGAMGITFKAFDTNLRFPVALKVINAAYLESDTARQRFLREARAAAALRHPNVASVFNLGTEEDRYFYVMEFIDGETVEACVRRKGPFEAAEALNIGLQVARALAVAAKQQLVHRDLKPSNLMLVSHEGEQIVKVIDFGLAKVPRDAGDDSSTLTIGGFVGTPHFASPEQIEEGEVDIRSDIYSLGVTLYYMLTGQSPFSGSTGQVMSQQLYKPLPLDPLEKLPSCVVSLLQQMTDKDRNKRPQTPQDLQKAITACLKEIETARPFTDPSMHGSSSAFETLDLSSASDQPLATGTVLEQRYKLIEELAETPIGRSFLADDISLKRRVNVWLLSQDFLSDSRRLGALKETVGLTRASPHRMLREIYALETVTKRVFLVQENVVGPSMLEILRARSILTAPEVVRLVSLLAPLADHARVQRLQHIDITLSGIHLAYRGSSTAGVELDLLRRPLINWELLEPKVDAINFSALPSDVKTWSSPATMVQAAPGSGPPDSSVRLLGMLAYESLGGPRKRLETTGQYTPVAALTQEGNAALRRAIADEFPSAEEFARQLAAVASIGTSASDISDPAKQHPQAQERRPSQIQERAEIPRQPKRRAVRWRWVLILCCIPLLGITAYLLSLFHGSDEISEKTRVEKRTPPEIHEKLIESHELPSLSVRTEPPHASVLLDGKPPQSPPDTFTHIPFGAHQLTVTAPDYEPLKQEIQIHQGMGSQIHLQLTPKQELDALSVVIEPAGASILLDEKPPQSPPNTFAHVHFGTHQLTANIEGYEPLRQEIQVHKGTASQMNFQLTPKQELDALSIITKPAGASIFLDGKPPESPPNTFTHVPFGTHQLTASLEDYEPLRQEIQVHKGTAAQIHLQLTPKQELDTLSIVTKPAGASIFLDGKPPESPPETFTRVPFGAHQVIAALNKYQPIRKTIDVRQGMARKINVELTPSSPDDIEWMISLDSHRLQEAHKEFTDALAIYRELADKNPELYRQDVAKTLNNLAILDSRQGRPEDARQEFIEALQIHRELSGKDPETYRPLVATTLNNLANSDLDRGRLDDARKEFAEALQIRRELAQKNPDTYAPFVARTLNNLAILDRRQNRIDEARGELEEALQIYRGLAQKNKEIHAPFVAMTLNNLGNLTLDQGRLDDARKEFAEALQIRRELAQKNPDVYRQYTAASLNNLAITDSRLNRLEDARKEFAEALDFYRELAQKNEATYRPSIAAILSYLGEIDLHQGRTADARKELAESLQIYETLAGQDPDHFSQKVTHLKKLLEQLSGNDKNSGRIRKDQ